MEQWLDGIAEHPEWLKMLVLGISTLGSEDLTTISAGVLASKGVLHPATAVIGCFLGIFIGDGLLYVVGLVLGRRALKWPLLRAILPESKIRRGERWFRKNGMTAIIVSRFLPGTRLPTYFAAGLMGSQLKYFLLASGIATALWTPMLVFSSWFFGDRVESLFRSHLKYQWLSLALGVLLMFLILRMGMKLVDWKVRRRLRSRWTRLIYWEFWPLQVFYLPVFIYNFWLAIKYRRVSLPLLANPGIEFSGYVGESKSTIMSSFKGFESFLAKFRRIPPGLNPEEASQRVLTWMAEQKLAFPIILKPDIGQRGAGVKRAVDPDAVRAYFEGARVAVQAQEFVPGPYEFGVFYMRLPDQAKGVILGLTGKEFPFVVGDGVHDLESLILRLPAGMGRYHIYLKRFKARLEEVPQAGEVIPLVRAGNHCLGAIFKDSSYLITDALIEKFDEISKSVTGFYIGRYDVRAENLEQFRTAQNFKIIELNGASSEPGHIYDARHNLLYAYKTLFQMYGHLWEIGHQNACRGLPRTPLRVLLREIHKYRKSRKERPVAE